MKTNIRIILLLLTFSLLTSFSFSPWNFWILGFFSFTPIFYLLDAKNKLIVKKRQVFLYAFIASLLINLLSYHWLFHTLIIFGHLPAFAAIIIFLAYSVITGGKYFIFFLFYFLWKRYQSQKNVSSFIYNDFFIIPFIWAIAETLGWQLFPYYGSNLAAGNTYFIQSVDIFGIRGLSVFWMFFNVCTYQTIKILYQNKTQLSLQNFKFKPLMIGLSLFLVFHIYGFFSYNYWQQKQKTFKSKNIGVVQGNTPLAFTGLRSYNDLMRKLKSITGDMVDQTLLLGRKADLAGTPLDLIVWPESAVPFLRFTDSNILRDEITRLQSQLPVQLIINDVYDSYSKANKKTFSNMWLLDSDGTPLENYQKVFLLPFGEFIPFGDRFPQVYKWFPEVSNFNKGERFVPLPAKVGNIIPLICYEIIPDTFLKNFIRKRNENLIINITNDSWFGNSIESRQHLELGRIRAIEYRLPIVRAVNAGISSYIDISGDIKFPTKLFKKESRNYQVFIPESTQTIYSYIGLIPYYLYILFFTILLSILFITTQKK